MKNKIQNTQTNEHNFYNNNVFNIFFINKQIYLTNLITGIGRFDKKKSIYSLNKLSSECQGHKTKEETKYFNFLPFLSILFLLESKFYSLSYLIGLPKFLASYWCPIDTFYQFKHSFLSFMLVVSIYLFCDCTKGYALFEKQTVCYKNIRCYFKRIIIFFLNLIKNFNLFSKFKFIFSTFLIFLTFLTILTLTNFSNEFNADNHGFKKLVNYAEIRKQNLFLMNNTDHSPYRIKNIPLSFFF